VNSKFITSKFNEEASGNGLTSVPVSDPHGYFFALRLSGGKIFM
jgi:hypothetical protein